MTRATGDDAIESERISIFEILSFLTRRAKVITGCALALFLVVAVVLLLRKREYTSSASFTPQASDRMSSLAGLAAQFGVAASGPDVSESPAFYADLLRTREVMTAILQGEYRFQANTGMVTAKLINLMKVKGSSDGRRMTKAIEELSDDLEVEQKSRTGVVAFRVPMNNPELAQQVVQRFLDEISKFSLEKRNSKASAERRFTEGRISDLQIELHDAEQKLQSFLQANRDYRNSPALSFQYDRLSQEVEFLRSVRNTVAQAHEKARMDEARDTPVITVIEKPNLPARPDSRGLAKFGLAALIVGGLLGIAVGFTLDLFQRSRPATQPELPFQRPAERLGNTSATGR